MFVFHDVLYIFMLKIYFLWSGIHIHSSTFWKFIVRGHGSSEGKVPWTTVTLDTDDTVRGSTQVEWYEHGGHIQVMNLIPQWQINKRQLRIDASIYNLFNRIPGDIDEVNRLKAGLSNKWAFPGEPLNFDASVPASLLKLWLRQLHEPLIPYDIYNDCLEASNNPSRAIDIVSARLPHINRLVLAYVIRFLQVCWRNMFVILWRCR